MEFLENIPNTRWHLTAVSVLQQEERRGAYEEEEKIGSVVVLAKDR